MVFLTVHIYAGQFQTLMAGHIKGCRVSDFTVQCALPPQNKRVKGHAQREAEHRVNLQFLDDLNLVNFGLI